WIVGDSEVVDPTPGRDAWRECNPLWNQFAYCIQPSGDAVNGTPWDNAGAADGRCPTPGVPTANDRDCLCNTANGTWTPAWTCAGTPGDPSDFNNQMVFERVWVHRERLFFGLRFLWEHLALTGQFATDVTNVCVGNSPSFGACSPVPGWMQWTGSIGVG